MMFDVLFDVLWTQKSVTMSIAASSSFAGIKNDKSFESTYT